MKNTQYKLDKELLSQLYKIIAPSEQEFAMQNFLMNFLIDVEDVDFMIDQSGNILVTKGESETYPCICAHMDEVFDSREVLGRVPVEENGKWTGYSIANDSECGLGADDKNGIYIALEALRILPAVKVVFTVSEEQGGIGASEVELSFFDDCRFVLEADRKGNSDLIIQAGGIDLCSDEFLKALREVRNKYHYRKQRGLLTDVMVLKDRGLDVSCLNISCGYYEPHTLREYTVSEDLEKALNFVMEICETVTETYPHFYAMVDDKNDWYEKKEQENKLEWPWAW